MPKYLKCSICGAVNPTVKEQVKTGKVLCADCVAGKPIPKFVKMKGQSSGKGKGKQKR
jgi:hypothetical protein